MRKFALSLVSGFITNNLVGTLVALIILNPMLNPMFGDTVRSDEEGLQMPSLLFGYFVLTLLMVLGYPLIKLNTAWYFRGVIWGALVGGIVFFSGHLIIAGWSVLPSPPMLISGLLDCLATIATGLVIAYFYRNDLHRKYC